MSAQHTPGPWKVVWNGHFHEIVSTEGQIGDACSSQFIKTSAVKDTELAEANARVMAVSPELLEALEKATQELRKAIYEKASWTWATVDVAYEHANKLTEQYRVLIAKAKGEA